MKKIQIKLEFNEQKMRAIKVSLKEKNIDFDEEIVKFLNGLYNKNVPKSLKNYIEMDLKFDGKMEEIKKEKVIQTQDKVPNNENQSSGSLDNNIRKY